MKVIQLNPAQFPLVYELGLRTLCVQESAMPSAPTTKALALFTDKQTNRNFIALVEGVTYLPSSGGCSSWYVLSVGRPLCDVELVSEEEALPFTEYATLAYYKHLNGIGHWVRVPANHVPAMIQYAGPGGHLIKIGQAIKLDKYEPRPGGWWLEEEPGSTNAQPKYAVRWKDGQYKNYLNQ